MEQVTGPAALARIQPGDIVLGVNRTSVRSIAELRDAVKAADGDVALLIERKDGQIFVPIKSG